MARPLRFCFLSIFYPPYSFGGDAIFVSRLANALACHGHEVDVIHCIDSYKVLAHREPEHDFINHPNVTVHGLRSRMGRLSPLVTQQTGRPWPKSKKILDVFYSKKFDVIHYHNISLFGPGVLRLSPTIAISSSSTPRTSTGWSVPCTSSGKTMSASATNRNVYVAR